MDQLTPEQRRLAKGKYKEQQSGVGSSSQQRASNRDALPQSREWSIKAATDLAPHQCDTVEKSFAQASEQIKVLEEFAASMRRTVDDPAATEEGRQPTQEMRQKAVYADSLVVRLQKAMTILGSAAKDTSNGKVPQSEPKEPKPGKIAKPGKEAEEIKDPAKGFEKAVNFMVDDIGKITKEANKLNYQDTRLGLTKQTTDIAKTGLTLAKASLAFAIGSAAVGIPTGIVTAVLDAKRRSGE